MVIQQIVQRCRKSGAVLLGAALLLTPATAGAESLTAWCGGGFTGGGSGMRIAGDGAVTRLARTTAAAPLALSPLGQDQAAFRRWSAALEAAGFAALRLNQPGNMTCSLVLETGAARHAVAWPGITAPAGLPAPVVTVFEELRRWAPD